MDPTSTLTITANSQMTETIQQTMTKSGSMIIAYTIDSSIYSLETITTTSAIISAYPIIVRWHTSDSAIISLLLAASASPTITSTTTTTSTSGPVATSHTSHISGGAIAAIAVGALAFLLILVGALLLWRRNRLQMLLDWDAWAAGGGR